MANGRSADDWAVIKSYLYWLLQHAQGRVALRLPEGPPRTIEACRTLANGWAVEHRLTETLQLTSDALKDASGSLAAAHRTAAAVVVVAPSPAEIAQLETDLRSLSEFVKRDLRARAVSEFLASAAERLESMQG